MGAGYPQAILKGFLNVKQVLKDSIDQFNAIQETRQQEADDRAEIKAGDQRVIRVEFDPNYHEEPEGKFFRTIFLATEPKVKEEVELKIWVEIDLDLGPDAYKQKAHTH